MMWLILAAQEASPIKSFMRYGLLDMASCHQVKESPFILSPITALFFVGVKHFLRGREYWLMNVTDSADRLQEVTKVVPLRESRELRNVV